MVLDDTRVLDFARYVAGPLCATVLGDFGADVIRVERVGGSEDRTLAPVTPDGQGAIFLQLSRNKRSLTLDTRKPGAEAILQRLIASAEVVITAAPPAALPAMGLSYEQARAIRPDIIHCNVSGFGADGPWAERGGFDSIGQAMSGAAYLSGTPEQPMRQPVTWVDHTTGLYAAIGVLMAIMERRRTGQGQEVQASLLGSALSIGATYLIEQALTGVGRTAALNRSFVNGPTDMFACTDGWIVTQVVGDALFRRWARMVGVPDWIEDPRFASDTLRGENGEVLSARMAQWCNTRSVDEAIEALAAAAIPAGPVLSPQAALDHPQVQAMNLFQDAAYPTMDRPAPILRLPVALSQSPSTIRTPAAIAGAHNHEILGSLGFAAEDIAAFERDGVI